MTSWENTGTQINVLPSAVQQLGLNADLLPPERNILTYSCTVLTPGICAAFWKAGGGHAVLSVGRIPAKSSVLFLDPWYGPQEIESSNLPKYRPVDKYRIIGDKGDGKFGSNVIVCKK